MRQYKRQYRLELKSDSDSLIIDTLRLAFSVVKDIQAQPNPAQITVYNLNPDHVQKLLTHAYKQAILSVGYERLMLLFAGDIGKARIKREGLDFVLTFECGDGLSAYVNSRSATSLQAGATDKAMIEQLMHDLSLSAKAVQTIHSAQYPRGQVLNGDTRAVLDRIAKTNHAQWSIQDGKLLFLPLTYALATSERVVLSQKTGMIHSPEQSDNGLEVTCLCNPSIQVGALVEVQSIMSYFNGQYKVIKVEHKGDSLAGDWYSKLTLIGGKFTPIQSEQA